MKRRYFRKKRSTYRRKRTTKRSSKYARKQQKAASTWIRKKYTRTFVMEVEDGLDTTGFTVSLIGGRNAQSGAFT